MPLPNFSELYRDFRSGPGDRVTVHVGLRTNAADSATLEHLAGLGLEVQTVVGNMLVGLIPTARLEELRSDPVVAAVEQAVTLSRHSGRVG